uniref:Aminoglycoside phosphotransferase domain-containing protein n=1 Tax=Coccidioides posadasii RMSCC 3488 TaxID=454284 RepID=A0A0J6F861_COCPO|nr:hypothetical protein CPAG_02712 [Coccidioides posadasii RMSCC 3488]
MMIKRKQYKPCKQALLPEKKLSKFNHIGALTLDSNDKNWVFEHNRPLSILMNEQTLAGFNPSRLIAPNQVFHSAIDYIFMIHQALLDEFHLRRDSVCGESDARSYLYGLHNSRQFLIDWVKPEHNHGPFVLMHGDLRSANILVDDDLNIVSVLDWEWSHTIPLQMFVLSTLAQWLRSAWNLEGV